MNKVMQHSFFTLTVIFLLVSCGGGSENNQSGSEVESSLIGPLPADTAYSIDSSQGSITFDEIMDLPADITNTISAYSERGDLIYWGSSGVAQFTGQALNAQSTAIMMVYSLLVQKSVDVQLQEQIISLINNHPQLAELASVLESLVLDYGYMNLDVVPDAAAQLVTNIINDIRTTVADKEAKANDVQNITQPEGSLALKTGSMQVIDGEYYFGRGTLELAELTFADDTDKIQIGGQLLNLNRLFFQVRVYQNSEDAEAEDGAAHDSFIISPREDVGLVTIGSAILGAVSSFGDQFALTDLARSQKTRFEYKIPEEWAMGQGSLGRHWIVADPNRNPFPRLLNTLNTAAPMLALLNIEVPNLSKLADPNDPLVKITKDFVGLHVEGINSAYQSLRLSAIWKLSKDYMKIVVQQQADGVDLNRFDRVAAWGKRFFDFADKVTSTVNTIEALQQSRNVKRKTFEIDPVPIEITEVTSLSGEKFRVHMDVFGSDMQPLIGDNDYAITLYGMRTLNDKLTGPISEITQFDWSGETELFAGDESSISIDIEVPPSIFWVVAIPGRDAPCLPNAVCEAIQNTDLFPVQTEESRALVNKAQNIALLCNGDYDISTNTCWQEQKLEDGTLISKTPFVDGVRNGLAEYFNTNGDLSYTSPYVEKEITYLSVDPDGTVTSEVMVPYGVIEGIATTYHPNGEVASEHPYVAKPTEYWTREPVIDEQTGEIGWNETGESAWESVTEGVVKRYDENKVLISEDSYKAFAISGYTVNKDGDRIDDYDSWESALNGLSKVYYESGNIYSETPFSAYETVSESHNLLDQSVWYSTRMHGVIEGIQSEYHDLPNKPVKLTTPYVVQPATESTSLMADSQLESKESWIHSVIVGIEKGYYSSGLLEYEQPFQVVALSDEIVYDTQGNIRFRGERVGSAISGMVKTYYENTEQGSLTTYQPFKRSLESYDYDTDSHYRSVREEAVGLPAGQYQYFYPSGSLQEVGNFTAFSNLSYALYDDQQRVSFKGIKSASAPSGSRIEYYESGGKSYETDVAQFTESRVSYWPTNIKQSEEAVLLYADSGPAKEYWENGNLKSSQTQVTRQYSDYEYYNNGNTSMIYPHVVSLVDGVQTEYYETNELQSETPYEIFTIGGEQEYFNGQLTGETNLAYASVINGGQTEYYKHGQVSATNPYSVYIEPESEQSGVYRYEREVVSHKLNGTAWSYTDNTTYPDTGAYVIRRSDNYTDGELLSTTTYYSDGTTTSP